MCRCDGAASCNAAADEGSGGRRLARRNGMGVYKGEGGQVHKYPIVVDMAVSSSG